MKIMHIWFLFIFANQLANIFGIDPVVGGIGAVLSGGGAFLCKKFFYFS